LSLTDEEIIELEKLIDERDSELARDNMLNFVKYTMPEFEPTWFHKTYIDILDRFAKGYLNRLIVSVPPQHGKSEQSSRRLPAYIFGLNPKKRIALVSYNQPFASKFNRSVQRIIDDKKYNNVFPNTFLNESNVVSSGGNWLRNTEEFETVDHGGYFKAVGVGGGLTGNSVDVLIMDDLYKDYQDATSPTVSEKVWEWYLTVAKTRLHNESQELIVFTRWDENDLVGRLEKAGKVYSLKPEDNIGELDLPKDVFIKINFEALKESEANELDPRDKGEALWESKHSREKMEEMRGLDPQKFNALYQGEPRSKEGLMYQDFKTYLNRKDFKIIKAYCDTADEGKDYLVSVVYGVTYDDEIYILDVVCTQDPMEVTERLVAEQYNRFNVRQAKIESNNGGRGFARVIDSLTSPDVVVKWFTQTKNKQARIFSNSASVNRTIIMPDNWGSAFPDFYNQITSHKKDAKNKHDDCADVLTGIYEQEFAKPDKPLIVW
jgi:predicted phage terminase large subunit-like protein